MLQLKGQAMFYICNIDSDADKQGNKYDKVKFEIDATIQEPQERLRQERCTSGICRGCGSIGRLNKLKSPCNGWGGYKRLHSPQ